MKTTSFITFALLLLAGPMMAQTTNAASADTKLQVVVVSLQDVQNNHANLVRIARYDGLKSSHPFKAYLQVYDQYIQYPKDRDAMQELVQVQQVIAKYLDGDMSKLFKHSFTKNMSTEDILSIFRAFF